jgi:UDP-N-acetylglucosamine 3-dehydrogenase
VPASIDKGGGHAATEQSRRAGDEYTHAVIVEGTWKRVYHAAVPQPDATKCLQGIVVGLGVMGSHHLRVLRSLADVEVVAVVEPDDECRSAVAGIRGFTDLDSALAETEPDFVCIAVPAPDLAQVAGQVVAAGLAVFVEKPLAASEDEARLLIAAAEERKLVLGVGHVERFNPAVAALKQKLDAGAIGRIYQLHARRLSPHPNRDTRLGVAVDLATHDVDVMRYLTGSEVQRVYAEVAEREGSGVDDLVCGTLRFDDETTGLLEVNWLTPTKVRQLSVTGEGGMFVVDYLTQDLRFHERPNKSIDWETLGVVRGTDEGDMIRYAIARREPLALEWEGFLSAVRNGSQPPVSGNDGLAALSIARALHESGRTHTPVRPHYRS